MTKRLTKSKKQKMLFGVCGGISEFFNIDITILRIILIVAVFFSVGTGVIAYLICAVVMPSADSYDDVNVDNLKSANIHDDVNSHESGSSSDGTARSDSEFNSYFKN